MLGSWLQRHRLSLLFLLALLTVGGIFSAFKLPVALFPDIEFPRIRVSIDSGDRPADIMVTQVTRPLEQALRRVPGIRNIRSTTSRGSAELSIGFDWGGDMTVALLQVQSAMNQVLPSLPVGTVFDVARMVPTVFPIVGLALISDHRNLVELRDFAYFQLQPLLSAIPGVAQVQTIGGQEAEFQVFISPEKLRSQGLTFDDVTKALAANNMVTAVGRIEDYYRLYLILSDTRLQHRADIENTILHTGSNGIVQLSDIAEVKEAQVPQWTRVTANGHDAVLINIMQQPSANTVAISHAILSRLKNFQGQISKDIQIKPYYDQSQLVVAAALSVKDAIIIGAILAAVVLLLFLRNLRMTFVVAIILPCVLATTILILNLLHMSFNIMTLGGMAAAVGLIIDDSVVMLEHIMRRLSEGHEEKSTHGPVVSASMEMLRPLLGSSLATIIIFLPLAFLSGVTGGFFKALALTMAVSLTVSFLFAFLAVPLLGEILLKRKDAKHLESVGPFLGRLHVAYRKTMLAFLPQPKWLIMVVVALGAMGYLSYTQVGSGFMPRMDEGGFILDYVAPPGTSLTETDRLLRQVEMLITALPEVDSYSRRTGLQLGGGLTEANTGDFFIRLKKGSRRDIETIMAELRSKIENTVPGLRIETAQLMEDMIGDLTAVPQPIEIKIFSNNQATLPKLAKQAAALLKHVKGVVEITDGIVISGDTLAIQIDRVKASLLGLDPDTITQQLKVQLAGNVVSQIQVGEKSIGIRIWTSSDIRQRIQQLQEVWLRTTDGRYVSLRRVATVQIQAGQAEMMRENLKPMIAVKARIEGRDMGSTMRDVQTIMQKLPLPAGTYIEYGGLYQEQQKSFYDLILVFLSALLLVSILLLFLYEDIYIVLSILATTLLSLVGVFFGLWITGTELNISAMMGMTMIIGIITEIAIFYFAELTIRPYKQYEISDLIQAGIVRMRPILMTSVIAILALLPLALGIGAGSAMQTPLAIAIIFGLFFGVWLVLLVMPSIYLLLTRATHTLH